MRALKIAGVVVGALVALVVLVLAGVLLLVDPNDYRTTIEQRVAQATGRPLRIEGRLALRVFPWIAIDVGRVTVGNPPGFGDAPFLAADRVRIGAKLLPLLRGRLEARRIAVDGLDVALVVRRDGRTNWQDLTSRDRAGGAGGGPALGETTIAGLDLVRGRLTLRDDATRATTRLRDVELHTGALGGRAPVDVKFAGTLDAGDGTPATRVRLGTKAALDLAASRVALRDLVVDGERIVPAAVATGGSASKPATGATTTPFRVAAPAIDYAWSDGTLAPATLDVRWGALPMTVELRGERLTGERSVTGRFRVPQFAPREVLPSLGIAVPKTRDAAALGRASATGAFALTRNALRILDLDATVDRSTLTGSAGIDDFARNALSFDLVVDAIDLDAYRAPVPAGGAVGAAAEGGTTATRAPPTPIPFDTLRALAMRGRLAIGRLTIAGLTLTDVQVPVTAAGGDLQVVPKARLFGGTLGGAGLRLDARRSPAQLRVAHEIRGIDVGAAVKSYAKSDRLSGRADAQLQLQGAGTTDAALLDSLAGPISFAVTNGALEGVDLTYELQRARALLNAQAPPARTGTARTPFDVLKGDSQLLKGVLTSDPLQLETAALSVRGKGSFRLADQALDYRLVAVVRDVSGGGAAGAQLADLRSLEIPLQITGTVRDYRVRPDLADVAKARLRQEAGKHGDEFKKKATDKLRDRLEKLLGR